LGIMVHKNSPEPESSPIFMAAARMSRVCHAGPAKTVTYHRYELDSPEVR